MEKKILVQLGLKFKKARLLKGYTQEKLAHKIDKDHPAITRLERGGTNPTYLFLIEVCLGLEMELMEVLGLITDDM